jgi:hypothetical protein
MKRIINLNYLFFSLSLLGFAPQAWGNPTLIDHAMKNDFSFCFGKYKSREFLDFSSFYMVSGQNLQGLCGSPLENNQSPTPLHVEVAKQGAPSLNYYRNRERNLKSLFNEFSSNIQKKEKHPEESWVGRQDLAEYIQKRNGHKNPTKLFSEQMTGLSKEELAAFEQAITKNSVYESVVKDPAFSDKKDFYSSGIRVHRKDKETVIETYQGVVLAKGRHFSDAARKMIRVSQTSTYILKGLGDDLRDELAPGDTFIKLVKAINKTSSESSIQKDLLIRQIAAELMFRHFDDHELSMHMPILALALLHEIQDPELKKSADSQFAMYQTTFEDEIFDIFRPEKEIAPIYKKARTKSCALPSHAATNGVVSSASASTQVVEQLLGHQKELEKELASKNSELDQLKQQVADLQLCLNTSKMSDKKEAGQSPTFGSSTATPARDSQTTIAGQ